jgi:hypothetical protein
MSSDPETQSEGKLSLPESEQQASIPQPPEPKTKKAPKGPSRNEIARAKLLARIAPILEQLCGVEAHEFQKSLDVAMKKWKQERPGRRETQTLLSEVLRLVPISVSGAVIIKHFKQGSDWDPSEIVAAAGALADAIAARDSEIDQLGALLHGGLIPLLHEAQKQRGASSETRPSDDIVAALLRVHAAVWNPNRAPLKGLPNSTQSWLREANEWLGSLVERADIRAIEGQRLFGFDVVFELKHSEPIVRRPSDVADAAAKPSIQPNETGVQVGGTTASDVPRQTAKPKNPAPPSGDQSTSASALKDSGEGANAKVAKKFEQLQREHDQLSRFSDALEKTRDRLRSDLQATTQKVAVLEDELVEKGRQLDRAQAKLLDLEGEVTRIEPLEAELATVRDELRQDRAVLSQLRAELSNAEQQVVEAKTSEAARGRAVERAAMARQFREPLQQIESAAASCKCPEAGFIRDMAKSLLEYLTGGN